MSDFAIRYTALVAELVADGASPEAAAKVAARTLAGSMEPASQPVAVAHTTEAVVSPIADVEASKRAFLIQLGRDPDRKIPNGGQVSRIAGI